MFPFRVESTENDASPIKQEPGIGSSIPLEVISEHCCSARVILEWNHWWASVSQPVHLPRALLMPGIDAQTQKMVAALKNLNSIWAKMVGKQIIILDTRSRRFQKPNGEVFGTEWERQNINKGSHCRIWPGLPGKYSEASYDQTNLGCECTGKDKNNWV